MTGRFVTDGHLGGYVAGGDPDCMYPELWANLVNDMGVRSVLDVGCGDGAALDAFEALGCDVVGIDGMPTPGDPRIVLHDFTTSPCPIDRAFDLVWSCEFVEHVEERCVPNFVAAFQLAPLVLMTHAFPGQPGWHHVNCQHADYWTGEMAVIGYHFDADLTLSTRALAAANDRPNNHYARSGLAFTR